LFTICSYIWLVGCNKHIKEEVNIINFLESLNNSQQKASQIGASNLAASQQRSENDNELVKGW